MCTVFYHLFFQPFQDMCRTILKQVTSAEGGSDRENTSITIEAMSGGPASQEEGSAGPTPGLQSPPDQQGNWCCSIS